MSAITQIQEIVKLYACEVRIKLRSNATPASWSKWISEPATGHIETFASGPWASREVEWIEINPVSSAYVGRLVQNKLIDNTEAIKQALGSLRIDFQLIASFLRIAVTE